MYKPWCCCFGKESKNTSSSRRQNEDNTGAADDATDQSDYASTIYENPNQRRSQHRRVVSEHDYEVPKHVLSNQESKGKKTENVYDTPKPFLRRLTSSMRKKRGNKQVNTYEFIDCQNNVENEYQTVDELM
ncbi:uncharacterized protein [Antedon mediterranea]|uniref:uncharacterized protein n=1 Tax=Antedon mediterranea TaxID=105859 RepID=UPI003AF85A13